MRIGRVAWCLACIKRSLRRATNEAAGPILTCKVSAQNAGVYRAVLQRCGVIVELDQLRKAAANVANKQASCRRALLFKIGSYTPRQHAIHHQAMVKAPICRPQDLLAQDAAMRVKQRKRGVVADGADVPEVIGEALELGH